MDGENHGKWKTLLFNGWFGGIIIFGKRPYNLSKSWEHIPSNNRTTSGSQQKPAYEPWMLRVGGCDVYFWTFKIIGPGVGLSSK